MHRHRAIAIQSCGLSCEKLLAKLSKHNRPRTGTSITIGSSDYFISARKILVVCAIR